MDHEATKISSGVAHLDRLLGGLYIGDNVVWHDDAGSLASVFCLNFLQASAALGRPLIYVCFDRSPKNLLNKLGPLAENPNLTVLDCFTWGKGAGSQVFARFYERPPESLPCRVVPMSNPRDMREFGETLVGLHSQHEGEVRFILESLTGMQELWGGEEQIVSFYTYTCPRLYELNTIAYWVMEKHAHSAKVRAQINQIAQVVMDLSVKRGTTSLTILKAEHRPTETHHQPHVYWARDLSVAFEAEREGESRLGLGGRLKDLRGRKGLSQTELARLVGVTPSTISQVESNLIYPSLPALLKMAEVLSAEVSSFFGESLTRERKIVTPAQEAEETALDLPRERVRAWRLLPREQGAKAEPYLIELAPKAELAAHFFVHKGEEIGYLLSGRAQFKVHKTVHVLRVGDLVHLATEMPSRWTNPGRTPARLLWLKLK